MAAVIPHGPSRDGQSIHHMSNLWYYWYGISNGTTVQINIKEGSIVSGRGYQSGKDYTFHIHSFDIFSATGSLVVIAVEQE